MLKSSELLCKLLGTQDMENETARLFRGRTYVEFAGTSLECNYWRDRHGIMAPLKYVQKERVIDG